MEGRRDEPQGGGIGQRLIGQEIGWPIEFGPLAWRPIAADDGQGLDFPSYKKEQPIACVLMPSLQMGSQTSQSSSADDMFFDDFVILKKAKKPWVRKAPMISKGKKMPPARLHEGKKVSLVSSKATQEEEFQELHGKLMDFLTSVSKTKW